MTGGIPLGYVAGFVFGVLFLAVILEFAIFPPGFGGTR